MNFWERVTELLEQRDINKKTLAIEAGFNPSNISKGIKNNNVPSAETAVKIAKTLGVTVEYLVTGENSQKDKDYLQIVDYNDIKYNSLKKDFYNLSAENKDLVIDLVKKLKNTD